MPVSWSEFLIMSGIISDKSVLRVKNNTIQCDPDLDRFFIEKRFKILGINFESNHGAITILDPMLDLDEVDKLLQQTYEGGVESGEENITSNIELVEPPMRGIVVQINRLGLKTSGSCAGHIRQNRRTLPWLSFYNRKDSQIALELFKSFSIPVHYYYSDGIQLSAERDELYQLSLKLSEIRDINHITNSIFETRKQTLIELLRIPGKTGNEGAVREYVLDELEKINSLSNYLDFGVDNKGNILGSTISLRTRRRIPGRSSEDSGKKMLLAAHLDVKGDFSSSDQLIERNNIVSSEKGILGADDRAGVSMILNLLKEVGDYREVPPLKFIFTVGEEEGQYGAESIDPDFFEDVSFGISLDRRNCKDIVYKSSSKEYSNLEFAERVARVSSRIFSEENAFVPCQGGISDLRVWSEKDTRPCVNLSVGYFDEHTDEERLDLTCWDRTHQLVAELIARFSFR
jgi:putative aminopeptidase FrvX